MSVSYVTSKFCECVCFWLIAPGLKMKILDDKFLILDVNFSKY